MLPTARALTFRDLLRRYRVNAGLTQSELAERAGLSPKGISDLERGARLTPRRETVALLADALGLDDSARAALAAAARQRATASVGNVALVRPEPMGALPPLAGRESELEAIARQVSPDGIALLMLAGEPGIGKSRLLHEAASRAAADGWQVLQGGCHRRSGQEPYAPFVAALVRFFAGRSRTQPRQDLQGCGWLTRLLPELIEAGVIAPPPHTLPPEQERRLMFAALGRFLANIAGPAGTLLLLDDLHWAGPDALDLLAALVRGVQHGVPVRVLAAYRDTEIRPRDLLAMYLADLTRDGLAQRLRLEPLSRDAASTLLEDLLPEPSERGDTLRQQVLRRAGGVPYFLVSCAQSLRTGALGDAADGAIPWSLAESIRQRVAALPGAAQELLGIAAVVGRDVPRALLIQVAADADMPEREALAALDRACQARLLVEVGAHAYAFAHDVVREVVAADLTAARRVLLHRQVAEALERGPTEPSADVLALHFGLAGVPGKAITYLEKAGDRAAAMHANAKAEGYYRDLVAQLDALGRLEAAAEAREKLGGVFTTVGRYDSALEVLQQAMEAFRRAGDRERLRRASASIGRIHAVRGTFEEGVRYLRPLLSELDAPEPSLGLARLHEVFAYLLRVSGRYSQQLVVVERAASLARAAHDPTAFVWAEINRGLALLALGRADEALGVLRGVVPLARVERDLIMRASVFYSLAETHLAREAFEDARIHDVQSPQESEQTTLTALQRVHQLAQRLGDQQALRRTASVLAECDLLEGHPEAAYDRLAPLVALAGEQDAQATLALLLLLAWTALEMDDTDRAATLVTQAIARAEAQQNLLALMDALRIEARVAIHLGREPDAASALDRALALARAMPYPYGEAKALYVYGRLHLAQGEAEPARARLEAALAILNRLGERLFAEQVELALAGEG